jgi:hypothetical protein
LCAPNGLLAKSFNGLQVPCSIENGIRSLAPLTYGVYVFHGLVLWGLDLFVLDRQMRLYRGVSFLLTVLLSFAAAWLFRGMKESLPAHWALKFWQKPLPGSRTRTAATINVTLPMKSAMPQNKG